MNSLPPHVFAEFTPAELAEMTGLSAELQRVWIRRGQLSASRGRPLRYDAREAAEIFIRLELSRLGVSPSESAEWGRKAMPSVFWKALLAEGTGSCEVIGPQSDVDAFLHRVADDTRWADQLAGVSNAPAQYLFRADQGLWDLARSPDTMEVEGERLVVLYINLYTAGQLLAERAKRPLITFELPTLGSSTGRTVRRLTGSLKPHDAASRLRH